MQPFGDSGELPSVRGINFYETGCCIDRLNSSVVSIKQLPAYYSIKN
jgi:hypothetical protein